MSRQFIPDVVEVGTAAHLAKSMHWPDGYKIGHTPEGFPVTIKYDTVIVDCREQSGFQ